MTKLTFVLLSSLLVMAPLSAGRHLHGVLTVQQASSSSSNSFTANFRSFSDLISQLSMPGSCEEAKKSCLERCVSEAEMAFECSDTNGIVSSCACVVAPVTQVAPTPIPVNNENGDDGYVSEDNTTVEGTHYDASPVVSAEDSDLDYAYLESNDSHVVHVVDQHIVHIPHDAASWYEALLDNIVPETEFAPIEDSDLYESLFRSDSWVEALQQLEGQLHGVHVEHLASYMHSNSAEDMVTGDEVNQNLTQCQKSKRECELGCADQQSKFECIQVGLVFSSSCACYSAPSGDIAEDGQGTQQDTHTDTQITVVEPPVSEEADPFENAGELGCESVRLQCQMQCENVNSNFDFQCEANGLVLATSCTCVSESVVVGQVDEPADDNEQEDETSEEPEEVPAFADSQCSVARLECVQKCGSRTPTFECQKIGNSFAKSCACSANPGGAQVETVVIDHINENDNTVSSDSEGDSEPVHTEPEEIEQEDPFCRTARVECENKCDGLEARFECRKLIRSYAKSCVCTSSGYRTSSSVATSTSYSELRNDLLSRFQNRSLP
eukprot:TRINITY_DN11_c0_g1_i1.p1 TRINITY_DN11_c0_g1~~TRINITY_DN11_c0_g1_i1.p1  ORF type:complete len:553 (-),score=74.37 TRINITY_DN11_c0_g1_i1:634-2292(-)